MCISMYWTTLTNRKYGSNYQPIGAAKYKQHRFRLMYDIDAEQRTAEQKKEPSALSVEGWSMDPSIPVPF